MFTFRESSIMFTPITYVNSGYNAYIELRKSSNFAYQIELPFSNNGYKINIKCTNGEIYLMNIDRIVWNWGVSS